MSGHKNFRGKMVTAEAAVAEVSTRKRKHTAASEWYRKALMHERLAEKELAHARNYRERIRLLEEKFPKEENEVSNDNNEPNDNNDGE
jgi:hypothetical protein